MLKINEITYIAETNENIFILEWLKKLQNIIKETPNSFELGEKIKELNK
jgi:hypothetical protein